MTALQEYALNRRWCSRHASTGRRYRRGTRRCLKCGYRLPTMGTAVMAWLLRRDYGPTLKRMLAQQTPLWALLSR
jgi:hypothetical protein